jgi:hypothetical protein
MNKSVLLPNWNSDIDRPLVARAGWLAKLLHLLQRSALSLETLEGTSVYVYIGADPVTDRHRPMVKIVCADGRVLEEIVDRDWLRAQVDESDSHQITTPSGCRIQLSPEEAARLRESCRKITAIPQLRRPPGRG